MNGRIRPGFYVLNLIRIRNCGDAAFFLWKSAACIQDPFIRRPHRRLGPGQSPSGFRSRR
jgi:hypothetical protein